MYYDSIQVSYKGNYLCSILCCFFVFLGFISQIFYFFSPVQCSRAAGIFGILFSLITILLFCYYFFKNNNKYHFIVVYLISTFTLLISWRISVLQDFLYTNLLFSLAFVFKFFNYILCVLYDFRRQKKNPSLSDRTKSRFLWQLFFIRIFIAFIFIPHFTEKLFSGYAFREEDIQAFISLGIHDPLSFVILAGIIEFLCSFAIGCGFFTRVASMGAFVYLMVATYLGHHFSIGFIWASSGGGWEYPVLWAIILLSFGFFGSNYNSKGCFGKLYFLEY